MGFGKRYDMSGAKLSKDVDLTDKLPNVSRWMELQRARAKSKGYVINSAGFLKQWEATATQIHEWCIAGCICEHVHDTILVDPKCPVHGERV